MQHIGFIFFVIVIIVIAAYAMIQGGLPQNFNLGLGVTSTQRNAPSYTGTQSGTGSTIQAPQQVSTKTNYSPSASPSGYTPQRTDASYPVVPNYYGRLNINPSDIPSGFSIRDISPYFGLIRLSASPGSPGYYSRITLNVNLPTSGGSLNVTGWLLRGNRGSQYVPQAVDLYDPSGLTPQTDIYLKNGDTLDIYSTYSGIGVNLHLNKCIGYLSNANVFIPPLPLNCPVVNRSEIINFTGQCQNYILSLNSCQMPAPNPPVPFNDYACQAYLNKINYGGCFSKHRNDYDFFNNRWTAWTGSQFLDYQHDRLLLFDRQSLLVAEYNY